MPSTGIGQPRSPPKQLMFLILRDPFWWSINTKFDKIQRRIVLICHRKFQMFYVFFLFFFFFFFFSILFLLEHLTVSRKRVKDTEKIWLKKWQRVIQKKQKQKSNIKERNEVRLFARGRCELSSARLAIALFTIKTHCGVWCVHVIVFSRICTRSVDPNSQAGCYSMRSLCTSIFLVKAWDHLFPQLRVTWITEQLQFFSLIKAARVWR